MIKFYDVEENYIKFLQSYDKQVPNIKYDKNNKFVCGVILIINDINYYAPISHFNEKQQTNIPIYDNEKIISTVRFSFMFPAPDFVLTEKVFKDIRNTNKKYSDLLHTEYTYCKIHEDDLYKKALSVYNIGCNKNHRLNYACCDFKLLESVYMLYQSIEEAAPTKELNHINNF